MCEINILLRNHSIILLKVNQYNYYSLWYNSCCINVIYIYYDKSIIKLYLLFTSKPNENSILDIYCLRADAWSFSHTNAYVCERELWGVTSWLFFDGYWISNKVVGRFSGHIPYPDVFFKPTLWKKFESISTNLDNTSVELRLSFQNLCSTSVYDEYYMSCI